MDEYEKDLNEQPTPTANEAAAEVTEGETALTNGNATEADAAQEAPATDAEASLLPTGEDALMQELEGIRDLLQRELDGAQSGELIQELDDEAPELPEAEIPEEIPEEERCTCCGERRRDTAFGEDYPYCSECRDLMKAAPIKKTSVLCLLLMLLFAGGALLFCTNSVTDYATLLEAETYYANRCIVDAEETYYNYVSGAAYSDSYSRTAVKTLIRIFAQMGYIGDANDLITRYFSDTQLKMPWNKRYAAIAEEYTTLSTVSAQISTLLQDVMYSDTGFDYDEKNAALEKLNAPQENGTGALPDIYLEYYRYVLMNLSKQKSDEEMLAQLKALEALDDGTHPWLYLTNILSLASKMGDVETTKFYYDKCIAINVQEAAAYTALANAYRFTETPDPDKMMEVTVEAEEKMSASAVPTYLINRAVAYLLKDDAQSAMEAMETYINSGSATGQTPYTVQACNLYALCCVLTDDKDGYNQMKDVFASAGMEISDLVKQFKKGKITLNDVLTDNGGDI